MKGLNKFKTGNRTNRILNSVYSIDFKDQFYDEFRKEFLFSKFNNCVINWGAISWGAIS